jgi:hypothetical protein
VHDGGDYLTVNINGKEVCTAEQRYGTTPAYVEMSSEDSKVPENQKQLGARDRAMPGMKHISESRACGNMGFFKKGDTFFTKGYYNTEKHTWMVSDEGKPKDLMAIAILWAEKPLDWVY